MNGFLEVINNNPLLSSVGAAAIVALAGGGWKWWHDRRDAGKIYDFLVASRSSTSHTFRSTEAIAAHTSISEKRVAHLCSKHPKIRRNEKEKQSWRLHD